MKMSGEPILLTDKSRLQEIYDLRVAAWEASERATSVNRKAYPGGWAEELDMDAFHFVIFNEHNLIVASARISLHKSIEELPCAASFKSFILPEDRPFAFYSRLVVSPDYRSSFFFKKLDQIRVEFLAKRQIPFAIATCTEKRLKTILRLGFKILGKTKVQYSDVGEENAMILLLEDIKR